MKDPLQLLAFTLIVFFAQHTKAQDTIVYIPDAIFKTKLLQANSSNLMAEDSLGNNIKIDINNDSNIQQSEANRVCKLFMPNSGVNSLVGISAFVNLKELVCSENNLTSLDISKNLNLEILECSINRLGNIDVSKNLKLKELFCEYTQINSLDLSNNSDLRVLHCKENSLFTLDVSKNLNLKSLDCRLTLINNLDISKNTALESLNCSNNVLDTLDVSKNLNLKVLQCSNCKLSTLDISKNLNLVVLICDYNELENLDVTNNFNLLVLYCNNNYLSSTLDLSNNFNLEMLNCSNNLILKMLYLKEGRIHGEGVEYNFSSCNNIKYICTDEEEIITLRNLSDSYGNTYVKINSFCSTTSGGTFYTMKTNTRFDANNNGCTSQDDVFPRLKYNITSSTDSGFAVADARGNLSLDLKPDVYTIKPLFTHNYYKVVPAQATVILPQDSFSTQFCITPAGTFNDVSIQIIPTFPARPGFSDATYQIIYSNNGTTTVSGTIRFTFQDSFQDFVSSTIVPASNASGVVTYSYSNLKPFESRSITVKLRTNAPTDNPAVNGGHVLQLQAIATMNTTSNANTSDDTSIIRQTVVNSYDPNDKRCLEGNIVTPDLVGDFVNYLIRFENEGTANAVNIVVTDRIDTTKFDITSLEVTASSHSNRTLITEGNKLQFIFDNINLPFTEPLKHGFIAFQIKTKNNLVIGDSLKNYADIFFDYNLPITTNIAGSRIDTFGSIGVVTSIKSNTNKEGELSIYPNPSNGNFKINFESIGNFPINIKLIDLNGRIIKSIEDEHQNQTSIDISESQLSNGLYQIIIQADKDIWQQKVMIVK
jgi:hypothetical protein